MRINLKPRFVHAEFYSLPEVISLRILYGERLGANSL
jgi:hypothetical protein